MAWAFSSAPPASRWAVIPVARKVWQPILTFMPSSAERRWIIRQADPVHRRGRERAGAAHGRAEQGAPFVAGDTGGTNVFIEEGFELVVRRHFVALAAFFVQSDP